MNEKPPIDWDRIDPMLRKVYTAQQRGGLTALAIDTGIEKWVLSHRAMRLNLPKLIMKGPLFSPAETQFIINHYPMPQRKIQQALVAAGFPARPRASINTHISTLRQAGRLLDRATALEDNDCYNVGQVAELIGTARSTVTSWIDRGLLKADRTAPAGDRCLSTIAIPRRALREFMMTYPAHWSSRRCDHYWLVDLLAGERTPKIHRQDSCGAGSANMMDRQVFA